MANTNITHYSDSYSDTSFYITENDMSDLDLFFMYKDGSLTDDGATEKAKIIREPIFYFSVASHIQTQPVFQLGSHSAIGYTQGQTIFAGRIIINAFSNIPFVNSIIATNTRSGRPQDMPPLDLYIMNKRSAIQDRYFQDLIIKDFKIISWNFEQGVDTPGRYVVADFLASDFEGIHLLDYMKKQVYGTSEVNLTPEVYLDQSSYAKSDNKNPLQPDGGSNDYLTQFNSWMRVGMNWAGYDGTKPIKLTDVSNIESAYNYLKLSGSVYYYVQQNFPGGIGYLEGLKSDITSDSASFDTTYSTVIKAPQNSTELQTLQQNGIITIDPDIFYQSINSDISSLKNKLDEVISTYYTEGA